MDSLAALDSELHAAETMVLRMGSAREGTGTQFLLVRADDSVEEFFLQLRRPPGIRISR